MADRQTGSVLENSPIGQGDDMTDTAPDMFAEMRAAGERGRQPKKPKGSVPRLVQERPKAKWKEALTLILPAFALLGLVAQVSFPAAGLLYICFYMFLTFARPQFALLLVFALAPFVQDISIGGPFHVSIGELSLVLTLPAFALTSLGRFRPPIILWLSVLYVVVCAGCSVVNMDVSAITPLLQMLIYLIFAIAVFSAFLKDPSKFGMILDGALGMMAILAVLCIVTNFTFLGMNKNAWGAGMSGGVIIGMELWLGCSNKRRKRWLFAALGVLVACLILTLSRGGWLAAMMGTLVLLGLRRQFKLFLKLLVLLVPLIVGMWFLLPAQDRDYAAGFSKQRWNIRARYETIDNAMQQFKAHPLFGVGLGYRKDVDATNIVMISLAESGVLGFGAFIALHLGLIGMAWKLQKKVRRDSPLFAPVALAAALPFARLTHGLVDHYWSRGPLLQAWAAVGMAVAVGAYMRKNPSGAAAARVNKSSGRPTQ
jgi:O-antigen ligase